MAATILQMISYKTVCTKVFYMFLAPGIASAYGFHTAGHSNSRARCGVLISGPLANVGSPSLLHTIDVLMVPECL
jgi:hypothetical protein